MYLVSEAHEPHERVWQAQQVSRVLGRPHGHIHTPTTSTDRHQESSHYIEEVENISPGHAERNRKLGIVDLHIRRKQFVFLGPLKITDPYLWAMSSGGNFIMNGFDVWGTTRTTLALENDLGNIGNT